MERTKKITLTRTRKEKSFLGLTRTVTEKKTVEVPLSVYRKLKAQEKSKQRNKPYSVEEMMFYDDLFGG